MAYGREVDRNRKLLEGMLEKADEVLTLIDRNFYEIDSEKARNLVFVTTTGLPADIEGDSIRSYLLTSG